MAKKKRHPTTAKQLKWAFGTKQEFARKWGRRAKRAGKLKKWKWGKKATVKRARR